jgi:hypothetical protein
MVILYRVRIPNIHWSMKVTIRKLLSLCITRLDLVCPVVKITLYGSAVVERYIVATTRTQEVERSLPPCSLYVRLFTRMSQNTMNQKPSGCCCMPSSNREIDTSHAAKSSAASDQVDADILRQGGHLHNRSAAENLASKTA